MKNGTWEATIFSGVPFALQSENIDWSSTVVEGQARQTQRESELLLTLYADTDIDVHL
jgi:hypothetical protein